MQQPRGIAGWFIVRYTHLQRVANSPPAIRWSGAGSPHKVPALGVGCWALGVGNHSERQPPPDLLNCQDCGGADTTTLSIKNFTFARIHGHYQTIREVKPVGNAPSYDLSSPAPQICQSVQSFTGVCIGKTRQRNVNPLTLASSARTQHCRRART